jgi:acetyl-CoA C-acetyltransferase
LSNAQAAAGKKPLARIVDWSTFSQEPEWFTTAPAGAIEKLLAKSGWSKDSVDLYEINEAFSVVALAVMKLAGLPDAKVNVNGGAVALGHPLGASGARIVVTLTHALRARNLKRGVAAICLGGGEAVAVAIETV